MRVPLAWRNATHHKIRTALALSAIAYAVVLIFMQLALLDTCEISATTVTDLMDYDLLLTSAQYHSIQHPNSFPRTRLHEALATAEIASAAPVYMASFPWRNIENGSRNVSLVLGVVPTDAVFRSEEVSSQLDVLRRTDTVLMDRRA